MENKLQKDCQQVWIRISFFYPLKYWKPLLFRGIIPYVKSIHNCFSYHIQFNNQGGENIRLGLLAKEEDCQELVIALTEHISLFYKINKKKYKNTQSPESLFDNYPPNCIKYGLYCQSGYFPIDDGIYISKTIEKYFEQIRISLHSIANLAIILQVSLFESFKKICDEREIKIEAYSMKAYFNGVTLGKPNIVTLDHDVLEIFNLFKNYSEQLDYPEWIIEWVVYCQRHFSLNIGTYSEIFSTQEAFKTFFFLRNIIYVSLGLVDRNITWIENIIYTKLWLNYNSN